MADIDTTLSVLQYFTKKYPFKLHNHQLLPPTRLPNHNHPNSNTIHPIPLSYVLTEEYSRHLRRDSASENELR